MTATLNGDDPLLERAGHCIVDCGWIEAVRDGFEHGPYCERSVGNSANAVTEPGWDRTELWCTVVYAYNKGPVPRSVVRESEEYRDGVQLTAQAFGEIAVDTQRQKGWSEVRFNMSSAEARSLAAQLIAAADSHDHIDASPFITRKLNKIAEHLGVDTSVTGTK
jgi:hypothetical protein